ncbi:hypothetical protein DFS34DRAFT_296062 [Phlyctochytrium arcticum]|nr:hypothetical protein DFS34DRAFT_296062 [Phlyctochytrium arcticum]
MAPLARSHISQCASGLTCPTGRLWLSSLLLWGGALKTAPAVVSVSISSVESAWRPWQGAISAKCASGLTCPTGRLCGYPVRAHFCISVPAMGQRKRAWDRIQADKRISTERITHQIVNAHELIAQIVPANKDLIEKLIPSRETAVQKRSKTHEESAAGPSAGERLGAGPRKKAKVNAEAHLAHNEDQSLSDTAIEEYGEFLFQGTDLSVQMRALAKYKDKICPESHIDVYLAKRGVLLLKRAQFENSTLAIFGYPILQALMKYAQDSLPVKRSDARVDENFTADLRRWRREFCSEQLTHREVENEIAMKLSECEDEFERIILKTMLTWVKLLPPGSLNQDLSESARISIYSNFLLTSMFTLPQVCPLGPPKAVSYWSSTTPSKATAERKTLSGETERINDTMHDFAGHVLIQATPFAQSVDGEAKKSNAKSSLSSIHWDLARLGVAGRDAIQSNIRRGLPRPHHTTFQIVESKIIFYSHVPLGHNWCAMLEMGKCDLPESWEDSKFSGFLDHLETFKSAMVISLHLNAHFTSSFSQARCFRLLLLQLLYETQVNNLWQLLNGPALPSSPTRGLQSQAGILTTPHAKKTMDKTTSCKRPTNMTWK